LNARALARPLSLVLAAGAIGAFANSVALWAAGTSGLTHALGVRIAPPLTPEWLYPRIVWGALWGLLFLLPLASQRWVAQGLALSLFPTLAQLFVIFPYRSSAGVLGTKLGTLTPLVVLGANAAWGLAASAWLRITGR
jgi:hypothetical protein